MTTWLVDGTPPLTCKRGRIQDLTQAYEKQIEKASYFQNFLDKAKSELQRSPHQEIALADEVLDAAEQCAVEAEREFRKLQQIATKVAGKSYHSQDSEFSDVDEEKLFKKVPKRRKCVKTSEGAATSSAKGKS